VSINYGHRTAQWFSKGMEGRGMVYGGKELRKRYLLRLEWKRVEVMDNDSGGDGIDVLRQFG